MDKKQAKILYTINQNSNLTKLDIKNKTGYSMSTVLSCVKKLEEEELITCGVRKTKGGKAPSVINSSLCAYVLGVGYSDGTLRGVRLDLNGNVEDLKEWKTEESKENIEKVLADLKKAYPPVAIGVITEKLDYEYRENKLSDVKRKAGTLAEGVACFYRFFSVKNNLDIAILYIDNDITLMKSGEKNSYYNINSLFSPIINTTKGRLTYNEVLSKEQVKNRLKNKFQISLDNFENCEDSEVIAYRNRLNLTVNELITLADKLLLTKIIIIGGYLPENAVKSNANAQDKVFYAGDVKDAVAHCAGAMALESLYYYD